MPAVDAAAVRKLQEDLGGEPEVMRELLDTFFEEAPKLVETMRTALARRDQRELNRAAHSLKSTAMTFGAAQLSHICRQLEQVSATSIPPEAASHVAQVVAEWPQVHAELAKLRP